MEIVSNFLFDQLFSSTSSNNNNNNDEDDNDETFQLPVFVLPEDMNLSFNQLTTVLESGQQVGEPFLIDNIMNKPRGKICKVKYADNLVSLRRGSLKLFYEGISPNKGIGLFSISFTYDAKVTGRLLVYFGAKDKTHTKDLIVISNNTQWGPYLIDSGVNQSWNSKNLNLFITEDMIPGLIKADVSLNPKNYDIVISLSPYESPTIIGIVIINIL
jgi:hypothetical protein